MFFATCLMFFRMSQCRYKICLHHEFFCGSRATKTAHVFQGNRPDGKRMPCIAKNSRSRNPGTAES